MGGRLTIETQFELDEQRRRRTPRPPGNVAPREGTETAWTRRPRRGLEPFFPTRSKARPRLSTAMASCSNAGVHHHASSAAMNDSRSSSPPAARVESKALARFRRSRPHLGPDMWWRTRGWGEMVLDAEDHAKGVEAPGPWAVSWARPKRRDRSMIKDVVSRVKPGREGQWMEDADRIPCSTCPASRRRDRSTRRTERPAAFIKKTSPARPALQGREILTDAGCATGAQDRPRGGLSTFRVGRRTT